MSSFISRCISNHWETITCFLCVTDSVIDMVICLLGSASVCVLLLKAFVFDLFLVSSLCYGALQCILRIRFFFFWRSRRPLLKPLVSTKEEQLTLRCSRQAWRRTPHPLPEELRSSAQYKCTGYRAEPQLGEGLQHISSNQSLRPGEGSWTGEGSPVFQCPRFPPGQGERRCEAWCASTSPAPLTPPSPRLLKGTLTETQVDAHLVTWITDYLTRGTSVHEAPQGLLWGVREVLGPYCHCGGVSWVDGRNWTGAWLRILSVAGGGAIPNWTPPKTKEKVMDFAIGPGLPDNRSLSHLSIYLSIELFSKYLLIILKVRINGFCTAVTNRLQVLDQHKKTKTCNNVFTVKQNGSCPKFSSNNCQIEKWISITTRSYLSATLWDRVRLASGIPGTAYFYDCIMRWCWRTLAGAYR